MCKLIKNLIINLLVVNYNLLLKNYNYMDKYFCLHLNKRFNQTSLYKTSLYKKPICENKIDKQETKSCQKNDKSKENLQYIEKALLIYLP